jgi:hypothetical protein
MKIQTYETTKQQLINTTIPSESRTYKPFSHENVIDLTLEAINKAGFQLDRESYSAARGNNIATGKYTIKNVADSEMQLQISWLNSYDKSKRLTWGIGNQVRICMNGMISADLGAFKKKHQGEIQDFTPKAISEYVKRAGDTFKEMQKEREDMKKVILSDRDKSILIGRLFLEEELLTTTQLNIIAREVKMSSFDYKSKDSVWEFYNHVTLSLKELHPSLYMETLMGAHKFFVKETGISVPNSPIFTDISPNQQVIEFTPGIV